MWKSRIPLRDYQLEALDSIEDRFSAGRKKLLVSVPTGGGKTVIFSTYSLSKELRTLVIAHRDELLEQAAEKFVMVGGSWEQVGFVRRGEWRISPYTCGSIQTLYSNRGKLNGRDFDLVVVDESHHVRAPTYEAVLSKLLETNPDLKVLGVTATPFRSDDKSLSDFFEEMAYSIDVISLIEKGYLVPVKGYLVSLPVDDSKLRLSRNADGELDYTAKSVSEVFNTPEVNSLIVKKWKELAGGRKTIFYTASLEHALALFAEFEKAGIPAAYVDGKMPLKKRREILRAFKSGKVKVLTNMNVLTEGFDDPEVECIGLVRPTKSLNLYAQIVGRGLRIAPDKEDCLVLDFTGVSRKHTVVGLPELFGIDDGRVAEAWNRGEKISIGAVEEDGRRKVAVLVGEEEVAFAFEGQEAARYATKVGDGYVLICSKGKALLLVRDGDAYSIYLTTGTGECKLLKENLTEDYAWTVLTTLWKKYRDDWNVEYLERAKNQEPTKRQKVIVSLYAGHTGLDVDVFSLSRFSASNVLSFVAFENPGWLGVGKYPVFETDGKNYYLTDGFQTYLYPFPREALYAAKKSILIKDGHFYYLNGRQVEMDEETTEVLAEMLWYLVRKGIVESEVVENFLVPNLSLDF